MPAVATTYDRFRCRGGMAAALASRNEVPLDRELIVERDTLKMKMGDGTTAYNSLPYLTADAEIDMRVEDDVLEFSTDGGATWTALLDVDDLAGPPGPAPEIRIDSGYIQWRAVGDPGWNNLIAVADLQGAPGAPGDDGEDGDPGPAGPSSTTFPTASFDGGSGDIAVGAAARLPIPFGFDISRVRIEADDAGSLQIDIRVRAFGAGVPDAGDSICASARPTLASADYYEDDTLTGWTTAVPSDSSMLFIVTACTGIKRATLVLEGERS